VRARVDVRIGIVGFGMRSSLSTYVDRPGNGSFVAAVCDVDERGRNEARRKHGDALFVTDRIDELLDQHLDAVLILTPDHLHVDHAVRTLRAGVPTFVEKPLAITIEGCDAILRTAMETGTRLFVGHNMRHMPVVKAMRNAIQEGRIGAVKAIWCRHFVGHGGDYYFKDWHADRTKTTGLLLQKGVHDIDVIHWLAGGYTQRVSAIGALSVYGDIADRRERKGERLGDWYDVEANWPPLSQTGLHPVVDVEDISMANLILDNGVLASYQQCHFTPDYWRNYTIIGTEGRMENFGDAAGATIKFWNKRHDGYAADADGLLSVPTADGDHGGADPLLVAEFVRFALEGGPLSTSPVAAREAVAAAVAATTSLRTDGSAVDVPPLPTVIAEYFATVQPSPTAERPH
jgi:predicted dehydrogenase